MGVTKGKELWYEGEGFRKIINVFLLHGISSSTLISPLLPCCMPDSTCTWLSWQGFKKKSCGTFSPNPYHDVLFFIGNSMDIVHIYPFLLGMLEYDRLELRRNFSLVLFSNSEVIMRRCWNGCDFMFLIITCVVGIIILWMYLLPTLDIRCVLFL